jgi:hypothetical protein
MVRFPSSALFAISGIVLFGAQTPIFEGERQTEGQILGF